MPTVDSVNGTPAASAARTACTSPRRATMPASPTGASASGRLQCCPASWAEVSMCSTSTSTRWRSRTAPKSATLAASVRSSPAPPST